MPNIVGHAECKDISDLFPSFVKLYQNTADPLVGKMEIPSFGNTVAPPSVSDSWKYKSFKKIYKKVRENALSFSEFFKRKINVEFSELKKSWKCTEILRRIG